MAIYTMYIKRADDPMGSHRKIDMWAVMDDADHRQIAYCSRQEDAERIKALLVYDRGIAEVKERMSSRNKRQTDGT